MMMIIIGHVSRSLLPFFLALLFTWLIACLLAWLVGYYVNCYEYLHFTDDKQSIQQCTNCLTLFAVGEFVVITKDKEYLFASVRWYRIGKSSSFMTPPHQPKSPTLIQY
jgi:hypothetical protein